MFVLLSTSITDVSSFQAVALAWVAAFSVIASAALWAVIKLWPQIQELRDLATQHGQGIQKNTQAVTTLERTVSEQEPVVNMVRAKFDNEASRADQEGMS